MAIDITSASASSDLVDRMRMRLDKKEGFKNLAEIVQKYCYVDGSPYSFVDHEWQEQVIADPSQRIVMMKCSQVGASEMMLAKMLGLTAVMSNTRIIFTMPTLQMSTKFSKDRIDGALQQSPFFSQMITPATNSAGQKKIGSNMLYVTGSFGYNSGISVPAEVVINDEVDSSNPEVISLMNSRLRHAKMVDEWGQRGLRYKFSTPTTVGSALHREYNSGTKHGYQVKCEHCNKWTLPDFFRDFQIPGFDKPMTDFSRETVHGLDLTKADILCEHCKKDLFPSLLNPERRAWVQEHFNKPTTSYHVSPWDMPAYNTPTTVAMQIKDYALKGDYYNQVLGLPHSDNTNTFLTSEEFKSQVKVIHFHPYGSGEVEGYHVLGLDIGKMSHLTIGRVAEGRLEIVYMERILNTSSAPTEDRVIQLYDYFRCVGGVVDAGPDITLVRNLLSARAGLKAGVYVTSLPGTEVAKVKSNDPQTVNIDRTKSLTLLMTKHNNKNILYPIHPETDLAFNHLATTKKVRRTSPSGEVKELFIADSKNDHYAHSIHYCNIAAELEFGVGTAGSRIHAPVSVGVARLGGNLAEELERQRAKKVLIRRVV